MPANQELVERTQFKVRDLPVGEKMLFRVVAVNIAGRSPPATLPQAVTIREIMGQRRHLESFTGLGDFENQHFGLLSPAEHPKIRLPRHLRTKLIVVVGEKVNLVIPFQVCSGLFPWRRPWRWRQSGQTGAVKEPDQLRFDLHTTSKAGTVPVLQPDSVPPPQGKPRPVVTWLKDGAALEDKSVGMRTSEVDSILFIRSAERGHSGTYTMSVQIENMLDSADIRIQVVGRSRLLGMRRSS